MFTDRFIKLPIRIYDRKREELTGQKEQEDRQCAVLPSQIEHYHGSEDEGEEVVQLVMKSGKSFFVYLSCEEFERQLNKHQGT